MSDTADPKSFEHLTALHLDVPSLTERLEGLNNQTPTPSSGPTSRARRRCSKKGRNRAHPQKLDVLEEAIDEAATLIEMGDEEGDAETVAEGGSDARHRLDMRRPRSNR